METVFDLVSSPLGEIGLVRVWCQDSECFAIRRTLLPKMGASMIDRIRRDFPGAAPASGMGDDEICMQIKAIIDGHPVEFPFEDLDFKGVGSFTMRVLQANREIPRGMVITYGGLAARLGTPGGARAVGNALAVNPFPIIIPCHRVVRMNGDPGGFGGGSAMKRALLAMEGVAFDSKGFILPEHIIENRFQGFDFPPG